MPTSPDTGFLANFWRTIKRLDESKLNSPAMALRNSIAIALPLAVGIHIGNPLAGIAVTTGALNVAYSDGLDPYAQRARRMVMWSFLGAFAVFLGSVTGRYPLLAILVAAVWAMVAGLLVSISTRAGDLGLNTLVSLIVYAARAAMSPKGALYTGLLVLAGGLLQTAFALLTWPLRRNRPERRAIGKVYEDFAREVDPHTPEMPAPPLAQPSSEVQDVLSALGRDHSLEGERFKLLFDQADRLRLSIYAVRQLRDQYSKDLQQYSHLTGKEEASEAVDYIDQLLNVSAQLLECVGKSLSSDKAITEQDILLTRLQGIVTSIQGGKKNSQLALDHEIASASDVLAGQLRVVVLLTERSLDVNAKKLSGQDSTQLWRLQLRGWIDTLRANLDIRSAAFRHGMRLAVCVAIADGIGRSISVQRNYWLPMTVAVVLKPDFTATMSRGILRLCGTFAGLLLATILFHIFPPSALTELLLVGVYSLILRYLGPANYGIFSIAISGLIVFLIAQTGVAPRDVVAQRGINTAAGGAFALIAYLLWPTWEKTQVVDAIAEMIDQARLYFYAVVQRFSSDDTAANEALFETRKEWRRVRSEAEASVDRFASEPGTDPLKVNALTSILASSQGLVRSFMGLEAGVVRTPPQKVPPAFSEFSRDVEFTLYFLAAALRGSSAASETLPRIRDDYRHLVEARDQNSAIDEYVLMETDSLTVTLNTLREQVWRYVGASGG